MLGRSGWVKQWRKEQDSAIWRMPPHYYKIWSWLKMNVEYTTGTLTTTTSHIADQISWADRNREVILARSSVRRVLQWLKEEGMVLLKVLGGRNAQYYEITLCNWGTYQSWEEGGLNARTTQEQRKDSDLKEPRESSSIEEGPPENGSAKKQKRPVYNPDNPHHQFITDLCKFFYGLEGKIPPDSKAGRSAIMNEIRLILQKDMTNTPEANQARLRSIVEFAASDPFWACKVISLAELRKCRTGAPMKWQNIEAQMKPATNMTGLEGIKALQ